MFSAPGRNLSPSGAGFDPWGIIEKSLRVSSKSYRDHTLIVKEGRIVI